MVGARGACDELVASRKMSFTVGTVRAKRPGLSPGMYYHVPPGSTGCNVDSIGVWYGRPRPLGEEDILKYRAPCELIRMRGRAPATTMSLAAISEL